VLRGDVYRFKFPKGVGHEQHGVRFGVVVQAEEFLPRSVVIVAPTSQSARAACFVPK
jgi:mRNA interferase MazF